MLDCLGILIGEQLVNQKKMKSIHDGSTDAARITKCNAGQMATGNWEKSMVTLSLDGFSTCIAIRTEYLVAS